MRLQATEHEIPRTKLGGIIGTARVHPAFFIADQQFKSALAHRGKMRSPRDKADVGSCARQLHPEISTDRAGAVDADFHEIPRRQVVEIFSRDHWPALSGTQSQDYRADGKLIVR